MWILRKIIQNWLLGMLYHEEPNLPPCFSGELKGLKNGVWKNDVSDIRNNQKSWICLDSRFLPNYDLFGGGYESLRISYNPVKISLPKTGTLASGAKGWVFVDEILLN